MYIHIHRCTYTYIQIHTHTYIYINIYKKKSPHPHTHKHNNILRHKARETGLILMCTSTCIFVSEYTMQLVKLLI